MNRTGIDGDQIRDETLTGEDIKDGSVKRVELNTTNTGEAVITKVIAGANISITSTGVDDGTGDVTIEATGSSDLFVGGVSASYIHIDPQCVGGGDANGN